MGLLSGAPVWPQTNTPSFLAEGTIVRLNYFPGETNVSETAEAKFVFFYTNGWWQIDVQHVTPAQGYLTFQSCMRIPDGIRKFTTFEGDKRQGVPAAEVCPLKYPPPGLTFLFAAWLSLCPHPELPLMDAQTTVGFPNIPSCRLSLLNHPLNTANYALRLLDPAHTFLSRLILTNNGVRLDIGKDSDEVSFRLPPYDKGFREHDYELLETTNVSDTVFPMHSVWRRFAPKHKGGMTADDLRLAAMTELRVSRVSVFEQEILARKRTPARLLALDARPPNLGKFLSVNYFVTNDVWKPVSDRGIRQLAAIARSHAGGIGALGHERARWPVILTLMVILLSPPIIILVKNRISSQNRAPKRQT